MLIFIYWLFLSYTFWFYFFLFFESVLVQKFLFYFFFIFWANQINLFYFLYSNLNLYIFKFIIIKCKLTLLIVFGLSLILLTPQRCCRKFMSWWWPVFRPTVRGFVSPTMSSTRVLKLFTARLVDSLLGSKLCLRVALSVFVCVLSLFSTSLRSSVILGRWGVSGTPLIVGWLLSSVLTSMLHHPQHRVSLMMMTALSSSLLQL